MNKALNNLFKGDKVIWIVLFFLCMISIVEVFSASSNLTYKTSNYLAPILKHSFTIVVGVIVAIMIVNIPCRYFKVATPFLILLSLLLLILVLVTGESINGANRVMAIGGQTFQPSEIAKGAVILAVAQVLSAMQTDRGAHENALKFIMWITVPLVLLILVENLSTALLLFGVVVLLMFIGRVPLLQLGKLVGILAAAGVAFFMFIMIAGNTTSNNGLLHRASTWRARIVKFVDNTPVTPMDYDLDKDAQVAHANIAIVSSNYIGKGPGNSEERDFLSQAFSDFIYAIIIEEMGLGGAALVVFLYIIFLFRCAWIASRCDNNFPAYLVMGLALLLVVQASFNMLVAVNIVPVTGQPLPLISKGGTSTIINCAYIGAILSVSRSAKKRKSEVIVAPNDDFSQKKYENTFNEAGKD